MPKPGDLGRAEGVPVTTDWRLERLVTVIVLSLPLGRIIGSSRPVLGMARAGQDSEPKVQPPLFHAHTSHWYD